jgi:predicted enzyme related to lactoylglutathione lyase
MAGVSPYWTIYFQVADCRRRGREGEIPGRQPLFGPKEVEGVGRFAMIQDPQGAAFSIIQLE